MVRPTTKGSRYLGPKMVAAFFIGIGLGLAFVAPVLPSVVADPLVGLTSGGGFVILVGVTALAVLMVVLVVFYQLYLAG